MKKIKAFNRMTYAFSVRARATARSSCLGKETEDAGISMELGMPAEIVVISIKELRVAFRNYTMPWPGLGAFLSAK